MARDMNQCNFTGHLGADPQSRTVGETSVCSFSIAVSDEWKNKQGEKQESTEWVRVSAWGGLGKVCQDWLTKGKHVRITGKIKTDKYTDKDTGKDVYSTQIVASDMQMLGGKNDGVPRQQAPQQAQAPQASGGSTDFSDDIPFFSVPSYP